jgi:hypothetical protein
MIGAQDAVAAGNWAKAPESMALAARGHVMAPTHAPGLYVARSTARRGARHTVFAIAGRGVKRQSRSQ